MSETLHIFPKVILISANSLIEIDQIVCQIIRQKTNNSDNCQIFCEKIKNKAFINIKVFSEELSYKVKNVEEILREVSLSVATDLGLFIIIKHIENMSNIVASRLLKILEETTDNVFFILTTYNESLVLKTLLSRCNLKITGASSNHFAEENQFLTKYFINPTTINEIESFSIDLKNHEFDTAYTTKLFNTLQTTLQKLVLKQNDCPLNTQDLNKKIKIVSEFSDWIPQSNHLNFWKALFLQMLK